jgi:peptidoglycan/LPS O-acetylase OafA/YrhL
MKPGDDYRRDIDGLRAVAVLSVILGHSHLALPGGFIGVDVFFVISGFLITGLILRDLDRETFSLVNFWERRVRRIAPALLVMSLAVVAAGWFLTLPRTYLLVGRSVTFLSLLSANWGFYKASGYFAPASAEQPLLHTWSLAVEEQFYLFFPLLVLALARLKDRRRAVFSLCVLAAASLGYCVFLLPRDASATFYLLPTRAWELGAGAILAYVVRVRDIPRGLAAEAAALLGLVLILAPCFVYSDKTPFPGVTAVPPVLGTVLLIWAGSAATGLPLANRLLATAPMVAIGLWSYSIYLWHWPFLVLAASQDIFPLPLGTRALLVAASLVAGCVSWRWVETPVRKRDVLGTRRSLFVGATIGFAVLLASGAGVWLKRGFPGRLPERARGFEAASKFESRFRVKTSAEDVPDRMMKLGPANAAPQLLVWGDSHAMAVLPGIEKLCKERKTAALVAADPGNAPALGYYLRRRGRGNRSVLLNDAVMRYLRAGGPKRVLLAAQWRLYYPDKGFEEAFYKTVDTLVKERFEVYVLRDVPEFPWDVSKVLTLYSLRNKDFDRLALPLKEVDKNDHGFNSMMPRLKSLGARIVDPLPLLPKSHNSGGFLPLYDGRSLYRDDNHLTNNGAELISPVFQPLFR